jgi:hypothetical protein
LSQGAEIEFYSCDEFAFASIRVPARSIATPSWLISALRSPRSKRWRRLDHPSEKSVALELKQNPALIAYSQE